MAGPVTPNVRASVRDNLNLDSEGTEQNDIQPQKHNVPKISTDAGILKIDKLAKL
jgi:hypothetical protein